MKTFSLTKQNDFNHLSNLYLLKETPVIPVEKIVLPYLYKYNGKGVRVAIIEEMAREIHPIGGPVLDRKVWGTPAEKKYGKGKPSFTSYFLKVIHYIEDTIDKSQAPFSAKLLLAHIHSSIYKPYEEQVEAALDWCMAVGAHVIVVADRRFILTQGMDALVKKARRRGIMLLIPVCQIKTEEAKACVVETLGTNCGLCEYEYRQQLIRSIFRAVYCVSRYFVSGGNYLQNLVETFEAIQWHIAYRTETQYHSSLYEHTSNHEDRRRPD